MTRRHLRAVPDHPRADEQPPRPAWLFPWEEWPAKRTALDQVDDWDCKRCGTEFTVEEVEESPGRDYCDDCSWPLTEAEMAARRADVAAMFTRLYGRHRLSLVSPITTTERTATP